MTFTNTKSTTTYRARPFLKWAGGKSRLLPQFQRYYPDGLTKKSITRYIEPFLGAGAVFLDIIQNFPIEDAFLFDVNKELILVYKVVQRRPNDLISLLYELKQTYLTLSLEERRKYYYKLREAYNAEKDHFDFDQFSEKWVSRAAKMIFLNKTCFNGLYRVNSKGEFNVPFGQYERPAIFNKENILSISRHLKQVTIIESSFENSQEYIHDNSFVYFDPPYRPISATSNFTSYSKYNFVDQDQMQLAKFFSYVDATTRAKLMLSNSDPQNNTPQDTFFEDLYAGFNIHRIHAGRSINSKANARGKIPELLITNYWDNNQP